MLIRDFTLTLPKKVNKLAQAKILLKRGVSEISDPISEPYDWGDLKIRHSFEESSGAIGASHT